MFTIAKVFLFLCIIASTMSCYRMPEDDEYSLVPSTNNPNYTREKANPTPGVGY